MAEDPRGARGLPVEPGFHPSVYSRYGSVRTDNGVSEEWTKIAPVAFGDPLRDRHTVPLGPQVVIPEGGYPEPVEEPQEAPVATQEPSVDPAEDGFLSDDPEARAAIDFLQEEALAELDALAEKEAAEYAEATEAAEVEEDRPDPTKDPLIGFFGGMGA